MLNNPNRMTVDQLAVIIQNSFIEQNKLFDKRFTAIEIRLDKIETRLNGLESEQKKLTLD